MANLIINVRCTCEEEFLLLHKLHKLYQEDQLRKRLKDRLVSVQGNGDSTESITVKCEETLQAQDGGIDANGNLPMEERLCEHRRAEVTLADVLEAEALENAERLEA